MSIWEFLAWVFSPKGILVYTYWQPTGSPCPIEGAFFTLFEQYKNTKIFSGPRNGQLHLRGSFTPLIQAPFKVYTNEAFLQDM